MTELSAPSTQTQLALVTPPQRAYTPPRLTIYGTVQSLTHGVGDINGVSGTPDGG